MSEYCHPGQYGFTETEGEHVIASPQRSRLQSSMRPTSMETTPAVGIIGSTRNGKGEHSEAAHQCTAPPKGKQPVHEDDVPAAAVGGGVSSASASAGYMAGLSRCERASVRSSVIPWQGDFWKLQQHLPQHDTPVTSPFPVRFPATMLSADVATEGSCHSSQWLVGVVMHSYIESGRRQLMYVVLLEDGKEVHLPCGVADRLVVVTESDKEEHPSPLLEDSDFRIGGGHPSSHERDGCSGTSFSSLYSSLLRSSDMGISNAAVDIDSCSTLRQAAPASSSHTHCEEPEQHIGTPLLNDVVHVPITCRPGLDLPCVDVQLLQSFVPNAPALLQEQQHSSHGLRTCPAADVAADAENAAVQVSGHADRRQHYTCFPCQKVTLAVAQATAAVTLPAEPLNSAGGEVDATGGPHDRKRPSISNSGRAASAVRNDNSCGATSSGGHREEEPDRPPQRRRRNCALSAAARRRNFIFAFRDETWSMDTSDFAAPCPPFSGPTGGPSFRMLRMPTKAALFGRFWSEHTLHRICIDSNRYASQMHPRRNVTIGGSNWWPLEKAELKAFMAVNLLMGIKRLPNHRSYWNRSNQFLYCPSISSIMTCKRYEDITRCLHVADDSLPPVPGATPEFDRLRKMRWLLQELQEKFKSNWYLHQEVTVDETIIPYKGTYCPVRQYLPRKPTKWGVKVWCLADARHKYLYDFEIYTGSILKDAVAGGNSRDAKTPHEVVMHLMQGLHGLAHIVCTDNFFTSVQLQLDLLSRRTFAVGTIRCNRLGLPSSLLDLKTLSKERQGSLLWRMHGPGEITAVVFVDRKAVLMVSTCYPPIPRTGHSWPTVPRRIDGVVRDLDTSPVHKAYTEFMRGVDVADHLRGNYSSQTRSHKWWHKIFFFLLDTSVVNCYILNKQALEQFGKDPVPHLQFQLQLADELSRPWSMQRGAVSQFRLAQPGVHGLVRCGRRRKCRLCHGTRRTNLLCPQCGGVFLHAGDCFQRAHYVLRR